MDGALISGWHTPEQRLQYVLRKYNSPFQKPIPKEEIELASRFKADPNLAINADFNPEKIVRDSQKIEWIKIRPAFAGTWQNAEPVLASNYGRHWFNSCDMKVVQTFGSKKDALGNVWHCKITPQIKEHTSRENWRYISVTREENFSITNNQITIEKLKTSICVNKTTNKIEESKNYLSVDTFSLDSSSSKIDYTSFNHIVDLSTPFKWGSEEKATLKLCSQFKEEKNTALDEQFKSFLKHSPGTVQNR